MNAPKSPATGTRDRHKFLKALQLLPNTTRRLLVRYLVPAVILALLGVGLSTAVIRTILRHNAEHTVDATAQALSPVIFAGAYALDADYLKSIADGMVRTPNIAAVAIDIDGLPPIRSSRGEDTQRSGPPSHALTLDIRPVGDIGGKKLGTITVTTSYQESDALLGWVSLIEILFIVLVGAAVLVLSIAALKTLVLTPLADFIRFLSQSGRNTVTTPDGETEINSLLRFARDQVIWLATVVEALDSSQDRIAIQDKDRRLIYANQALIDLANTLPNATLGGSLSDLFPYAEGGMGVYQGIIDTMKRDGAWRGELDFNHNPNQRIVFDARLARTSAGGMLLVATDITASKEHERREIELQGRLAQAQKMEALGQLAGGIAHDFNNILGAARSFAELLVEDLPPESADHGYAARIVVACNRATELVQQILTFAQAQNAPKEPLAIGHVISEVALLLHGRLPENVLLSMAKATTDATVVANAGQLSQVLLNISINAADSMAGKSGEVAIRCENVLVRPEEKPPFASGMVTRADGFTLATDHLKPGVSYVKISIADEGTGIPQGIASRIFEPFFTTKDKRKGSGLGLAVVASIVAAHYGVIVVDSRPAFGTTFHIYLPTHVGAAGALPLEQSSLSGRSKELLRGHERILIVDDEVDVADAFSCALTKLGYQSAPVYSPLEALEVFNEDPTAWDLIVTDLTMPDMNGDEFIRRIKEMRTGIPIILCSGFDPHAEERTTTTNGADAFLHKPVTADTLASRIRGLLDGEDKTTAGQRSAA